jgi:CRP/FNR family cyclic AMP-dependent transcriptional regulator
MLLPRFYFADDFHDFESQFSEYGKKANFPNKSFMIRPNDMLDTLFFIRSGMAKLSILSESYKEHTYFFYGPGSIFPVKCTMLDFSLESNIVFSAISDVEAIALSPAQFRILLCRNPELAVAAIDYFCKYGNALMIKALSSIEYSSYDRICDFLYLYNNCKPQKDNCVEFSQEEIASITGLSAVQVSRVLQDLRQNNIVKTKRGKIIINDPHQLNNCCTELANNGYYIQQS